MALIDDNILNPAPEPMKFHSGDYHLAYENLIYALSKAKRGGKKPSGGKGSGQGTWITVNGRHILIGGPSKGGWKAHGTAKEAKEFSSTSKIKGDLFHGTSFEAARSIKSGGFKLSDGGYGKGVYLTSNKSLAGKYASLSGSATTLKMKVNVKNPLSIHVNQIKEASARGMTHSAFTSLLKQVRGEHDGLIVRGLEVGGFKGVDYLVVFNKRSIMLYD